MEVDPQLLDLVTDQAHFHALLMSLVHLTGDPSLLAEPRRARITDFVATDAGLAPEENTAVRSLAKTVLRDYFAGRLPAAKPLTPDTIQRMMDFVTGTTIPERYIPFLEEELGVARPNASLDHRHHGAKRDTNRAGAQNERSGSVCFSAGAEGRG